MKKLFLILFCGIVSFSFSQDLLIKITGDTIRSKVTKISEDNVEYKRFDNLNGPTYSISTASVAKIVYENGTTESLEKFTTKNLQKEPNQLIKKGNNVFITSFDDTSKKGEEYFIEDLNGWGYWNIVQNKESADFILELRIEKRGMGVFAIWAIFMTVDGQEFKTSESYKKNVSAFNGYNVAKPLSEDLVKKYFIREFK